MKFGALYQVIQSALLITQMEVTQNIPKTPEKGHE